MSTSIIILASMLVWVALIRELRKTSEKQNNRKIIIFTSLGTLLTLVLIIPLFQNIWF